MRAQKYSYSKSKYPLNFAARRVLRDAGMDVKLKYLLLVHEVVLPGDVHSDARSDIKPCPKIGLCGRSSVCRSSDLDFLDIICDIIMYLLPLDSLVGICKRLNHFVLIFNPSKDQGRGSYIRHSCHDKCCRSICSIRECVYDAI